MTPERWTRLKNVFEGALECPEEARGAWLDQACGTDSFLRLEAEKLLAADISTTDLGAGVDDPQEWIGSCRLVETLHVGATASVHLAIQDRDGDGFERRVAVKVAGRSLDHSSSLRFDLERQILASLQHPNIARLYDGGRTEEGRAYLVMEWVEGLPIDQYCDQHDLNVTQRLMLFSKVCEAVRYAQQNLVVHRDLKPSNILVDSRGEPKLLDFGIAKLLNPELSSREMVSTAPGFRPMTPRYASPEQVEGGAITTATDVYSLGVLLYELLTGRMPYHFASHDLPVVARAICQQDPQPSGLSTDLDAIVSKAMNKVPARRYCSAAELAGDIGRYVRHEPVLARRPTTFYKLARLCRRHRLATLLTAAAAVLALTLAAQSLRLRQALEDSRLAVAPAGPERARAEAVSGFLVDLFEHADPALALGETVDARLLVDRAASRLATELPDQPKTRAALIDSLGLVYRNLGLHDEALAMIESALELRRQPGTPPEDLATSLDHLSWQKYAMGDFDAAEPPAHEALALRRATSEAPVIAQSLHNLAELVHAQGRYDKAKIFYLEALELRRLNLSARHPDIGESLLELAHLYVDQGDTSAGEKAVEEGLTILRQHYGGKHPKIAAALGVRGMLEKQRGDLDAAIASQSLSLDIRRDVLGPHHPDTLSTLAALGLALFENGQGEASVEALEEALKHQKRVLPEGHPMLGTTYNDLGLAFGLTGRHEEAIGTFERSLEIFMEKLDREHPAITIVTTNLAKALEEHGDLAAAEARFLEVAARFRAHHPEDATGLEQATVALAELKRRG